MENMKHQDGYKPSAEDTSKLNEFVTWLSDHGYRGVMFVHKDDVGVSFCNEESADDIRHTFVNSIGHIMDESEEAAFNLFDGMRMAVTQIIVGDERGILDLA